MKNPLMKIPWMENRDRFDEESFDEDPLDWK